MSSLAATQADGYYLPAEYYDSGAYKKKSKNQWWSSTSAGTGAAGASSQAAGDVVRFELPYDGICERCQAYIKRGTRFNATKAKVGDYYSTPIYEFRMRCRACPTASTVGESIARSQAQEFVLKVNPAEFGFDYVSGIRKHQRDFVAQPDDHCAAVEDRPLSQTEVLETQQRYLQSHLPSDLEQLQVLRDKQSRSFHDADGNAALRATFRGDRRQKKRQLAGGSALGWRSGLELLEQSTIDETCDSKTAVYGDCRSHDRDKWRAVRTESIFARAAPARTRQKRRRQPTEDAQPDALSSAPQAKSATARRRSRNPTGDVVDLADGVETVESNRNILVPKKADATVKKRRMLTVLSTRTLQLAPAADDSPRRAAGTPVTTKASSAPTAVSSIASLLASYDSSSSDGAANDL
jgi:coiled-coil domain-containing protein 130